MRSRDEAFAAYVGQRRAQLYRTAYLLCGDAHRAEDVVQTALAKLYAAWPRVSRADSVDAYARRVVVTSHLDDVRRPWRRERPADDATLDRFALQQGGPTTQRALPETLGVAPRTVTTLVDELSAAGVVTREPHPTDRRATLVTMTAAGAELGAGLVAGQEELAGQLFDGVDDLPALVRGLEQVVARLRELTA
jgi:DNA-binding MarR family transcriptional regulator